MIRYEQLPPSAQKNYKTTNKVRIVSMFIGLAITLICCLRNLISGSNESILFCAMLGGIIHYYIHAEFLFKKLAHSLGIIGIFVFLVISIFGMYTGWVFLIADLILYLLKKPCIYPFENASFVYYSKKAQEELEAMNFNATVNAYAQAVKEINGSGTDNVKDGLAQLKDMLDNGLITENEYKAKKAQLLERL